MVTDERGGQIGGKDKVCNGVLEKGGGKKNRRVTMVWRVEGRGWGYERGVKRGKEGAGKDSEGTNGGDEKIDKREREEEWETEREEMQERIKGLEMKVEGLEKGNGEKGKLEWRSDGEMRYRMKEIERIEMKEREDKRRNVILKGVEVRGVREEKRQKKLWLYRDMAVIEAEVKIEKVRKLGGTRRRKRRYYGLD